MSIDEKLGVREDMADVLKAYMKSAEEERQKEKAKGAVVSEIYRKIGIAGEIWNADVNQRRVL